MNSKIQGPAAAMFDEPQVAVDDELFASPVTQDQMRMQIIETRLNELYDAFVAADPRWRLRLPINGIHRNVIGS